MKNWNTNTKEFKSALDKKIWTLAQIINFGFDGQKISKKTLTKHWSAILPHLNPDRAKMIEWIVWNKLSSPLFSQKSWNKSS